MKEKIDQLGGIKQALPRAIIDAMISGLDLPNLPTCQLLEKGETEKAEKLIKEVNKHIEEHKKLRQQLIAVLEEATQKSTKTTLPDLAW